MPVSTVVSFLASMTLACFIHLSELVSVMASPALLQSPNLANCLNMASKLPEPALAFAGGVEGGAGDEDAAGFTPDGGADAMRLGVSVEVICKPMERQKFNTSHTQLP